MSAPRRTVDLTALFCLAAGLFAGKFIGDFRRFEWDTKVSPVGVATLLLTIFVSFFFFREFEKKKYVDKLKKDALLGRLKACAEMVQVLEAKCQHGTGDFLEVVSSLKVCRGEIRAYVDFSQRMDFAESVLSSAKVVTACSRLHRLLTDTPTDTTGHAPVRMVGGKIVMLPSRIVEVTQAFRSARDGLSDMELAVILHV